MSNCEICGEPMPAGEEMFKYHGHSGPCPEKKTTVNTKACNHDWAEDSDGQTDMYGGCTKCGMSFQRYIHTECP